MHVILHTFGLFIRQDIWKIILKYHADRAFLQIKLISLYMLFSIVIGIMFYGKWERHIKHERWNLSSQRKIYFKCSYLNKDSNSN